jgi:hypothetical protein
MKGLSIIALTALVAGPVYADCAPPTSDATFHMPDGSKATLQEMLAAKQAVKDYNAAVEAFNSCLNLEQDAAIAARGENITKEERKQINDEYTERYNRELAKLQTVADQLNTEIRAYKTAHPAK